MPNKPVVRVHDNSCGYPAINVKWQGFIWDKEVPGAWQLGDEWLERSLQTGVQAFWEDAQEIAGQYWPNVAIDVYSAGRHGGWLYVVGTPKWNRLIDTDDVCCKFDHTEEYEQAFVDRHIFMQFAKAILDLIEHHAELYKREIESDLLDLEDKREAVLIRGEN